MSNTHTLAVAESLTGGLVGDIFVSSQGASKFFKGGIIAYSLSIKHEMLKVDYDLLDKSNGVSEDVCKEMAGNVALMFKADYGIATTGYAEEGKEPFRLTEDRYAYVSLCDTLNMKSYTTIVLARPSEDRNGFRLHVANVAEFIWNNRLGLLH